MLKKRSILYSKLFYSDLQVEKGEVGEYGFEDSVRNRQTSSGNLIIIDGSDKECDNTDTCKNTKVAKGKIIKNEVDNIVNYFLERSLNLCVTYAACKK